jgi:hypothetical protein
MTPGCRASHIALSMSSFAVTHTGQPGPLISLISGGRSCLMPDLKMATVCVPQISISLISGLEKDLCRRPSMRLFAS